MVLLLDNYDSFTYNLRDYVLQLGEECLVVRNDEYTPEQIEQLSFDSIIISPGPRTPAEAGITPQLIAAFYNRKPILGICLGHQAIGEFFGAELIKAQKPMHGKTSPVTHNNHFLFQGLPSPMEVMRYHSLVLQKVESTPLQVTAQTPEGEVMAVVHPQYPVAGVQFHPESILTPQGLQLLRNWFNGINK
jgi:anthranilate synthase/aminodeoxychorismate synthase-like glutamine amidotransferase